VIGLGSPTIAPVASILSTGSDDVLLAEEDVRALASLACCPPAPEADARFARGQMEPRLALLRSVAGDLRAAANARSLVLEEGEELAVQLRLAPAD
jgi:hypothetical protein